MRAYVELLPLCKLSRKGKTIQIGDHGGCGVGTEELSHNPMCLDI